jgi:hypothetical protein
VTATEMRAKNWSMKGQKDSFRRSPIFTYFPLSLKTYKDAQLGSPTKYFH